MANPNLSGLLVVTAMVFLILLNKRNPYAAAVADLIWFVPVIGMLLYWGWRQ